MNLTEKDKARELLKSATERVKVAYSAICRARAKGDFNAYHEARLEYDAAVEWYGEIRYMADDEVPYDKTLEDAVNAATTAHVQMYFAIDNAAAIPSHLRVETVTEAFHEVSAARREVYKRLQELGKDYLGQKYG